MSKRRKTPTKTRTKTTSRTAATTTTTGTAAPAPRRPRARRDQIAALHESRTAPEMPTAAPPGASPIDFGPVRNAACDLVAWALDLAENDVTDWPEARHRVRRVRRALLDSIRGRSMRETSIEDVVFTTQLLVRIFENDLGADMSQIALLIDQLGLPVDEVPIVRRPQRAARAMPRVVPTPAPAPAPMPMRPFRPSPSMRRAQEIAISRVLEPAACQCDQCLYGYRNAA